MDSLRRSVTLKMCDPLGKNFLLPSWYAEDFEEASSASLLGIV